MGYTAYTLEVDFSVPADKVDAALAALNDSLELEDDARYTSLADAVETDSGFQGSEDAAGDGSADDGFVLGYHPGEKYHEEYVLAVLQPLAPFVKAGSYVRFSGEDDSLWGFRVVNGELEDEWGYTAWKLAPNLTRPESEDRRYDVALCVEAVTGSPAEAASYFVSTILDHSAGTVTVTDVETGEKNEVSLAEV